MTTKEKLWLVLGTVLSIIIWGFFYGPVVGTIFTLALLFHEYGHYYWMGCEGIKNKSMAIMPPFGAIAVAKESWPSLGSESRIALAGPGFGLISAVVLLIVGWIFENNTIKISLFIVCWVNLFNLWMPIAVLDGGRVLKSILFSLNARIGIGFYYLSFIILVFAVMWYLSFFTIIVGFIILNVLHNDLLYFNHISASNKLVRMSNQEVVSSILLFLIISAGLYAILILNRLSFDDFINFILSN